MELTDTPMPAPTSCWSTMPSIVSAVSLPYSEDVHAGDAQQ